MVVVERVPDEFAFPPRPHQPERTQQPQLVRNGGLCHAERRREIADAERPGSQRRQEPHTCRITQRAKQRGEIARGVRIRQSHPRPPYAFRVDVINRAGIEFRER